MSVILKNSIESIIPVVIPSASTVEKVLTIFVVWVVVKIGNFFVAGTSNLAQKTDSTRVFLRHFKGFLPMLVCGEKKI